MAFERACAFYTKDFFLMVKLSDEIKTYDLNEVRGDLDANPLFERAPRIHWIADLSREKVMVHLSVKLYGC